MAHGSWSLYLVLTKGPLLLLSDVTWQLIQLFYKAPNTLKNLKFKKKNQKNKEEKKKTASL